MPTEIAKGLVVENVGDLIGGEAEAGNLPFLPPKLDGQPDFPEPGIYFGMPEEMYHSIHACSASGLKKLSVSSMDYWANSPLNAEREEPKDTTSGELTGKELGRAYHTRICEGLDAFNERYFVALDRDDVRAEAERNGRTLCVTIADIRQAIDALGGKAKGAAKEPMIDQLLDFDEGAFVWDRLVAKHKEANEGKVCISAKLYRRIEIAAAMIAGDPQLKDAFSGGHAEVSIFWYDEKTGTPMKARLDYLKMNHLIDLKSFANKQGKPVQRAIDAAISFEKYYIAVVVYLEAIAAAKKLVRESGGGHVYDMASPEGCIEPDLVKWAWAWAHQPEPEVIFVFQQTGVAPVTRGRLMVKGTTFTVTDYAVQFLKRKWRRCAKAYGEMPWVDFEPVVRTEDESLMFAATDFGDQQ